MKERIIISIMREPDAQDLPLPEYATDDAAGVDLLANVKTPVTLQPFQRALIPTGIRIAIPRGYEGQVRPRSGLAIKYGIAMVNAPGTIDADYRGEIRVILINLGDQPFTIQRGDRIAQLVIAPVVQISWCLVDTLENTKRGECGFGHTGVKTAE